MRLTLASRVYARESSVNPKETARSSGYTLFAEAFVSVYQTERVNNIKKK